MCHPLILTRGFGIRKTGHIYDRTSPGMPRYMKDDGFGFCQYVAFSGTLQFKEMVKGMALLHILSHGIDSAKMNHCAT